MSKSAVVCPTCGGPLSSWHREMPDGSWTHERYWACIRRCGFPGMSNGEYSIATAQVGLLAYVRANYGEPASADGEEAAKRFPGLARLNREIPQWVGCGRQARFVFNFVRLLLEHWAAIPDGELYPVAAMEMAAKAATLARYRHGGGRVPATTTARWTLERSHVGEAVRRALAMSGLTQAQIDSTIRAIGWEVDSAGGAAAS
ncbi:MAG: hypothetical protein GIX02_13355 [Candidatus Eremiobacteraeota bacterium]|nr:hypothetical protein [Candidatus Eremiobacteraeota bacterium]